MKMNLVASLEALEDQEIENEVSVDELADDAMDSMDEVIDNNVALESLLDIQDIIMSTESLDLDKARMYETSVNATFGICPALEGYFTDFSMEADDTTGGKGFKDKVVDFFKRMWKAISDFFQSMWSKITTWYKAHVQLLSRVEKKLNADIKAIDAGKEAFDSKKVSDGTAKYFIGLTSKSNIADAGKYLSGLGDFYKASSLFKGLNVFDSIAAGFADHGDNYTGLDIVAKTDAAVKTYFNSLSSTAGKVSNNRTSGDKIIALPPFIPGSKKAPAFELKQDERKEGKGATVFTTIASTTVDLKEQNISDADITDFKNSVSKEQVVSLGKSALALIAVLKSDEVMKSIDTINKSMKNFKKKQASEITKAEGVDTKAVKAKLQPVMKYTSTVATVMKAVAGVSKRCTSVTNNVSKLTGTFAAVVGGKEEAPAEESPAQA